MISLAENLSFPDDIVTQTIGILAKRRAGKSYTARRFTEQLARRGHQVVIVDPKGDWWGIRSSATGKRRGLLGIRNGEALRVEVAHYRRGPDGLDEISIKGKGKRFRVLPVPTELAAWVRAYTPPLAEAGTPLFVNPKTGGPWSQSSLVRVWRAMEKRLGLPHVKPNEALRHCFGTRTAERLIREGMTRERAVAELTGEISNPDVQSLGECCEGDFEATAMLCYAMADAMLAARATAPAGEGEKDG